LRDTIKLIHSLEAVAKVKSLSKISVRDLEG